MLVIWCVCGGGGASSVTTSCQPNDAFGQSVLSSITAALNYVGLQLSVTELPVCCLRFEVLFGHPKKPGVVGSTPPPIWLCTRPQAHTREFSLSHRRQTGSHPGDSHMAATVCGTGEGGTPPQTLYCCCTVARVRQRPTAQPPLPSLGARPRHICGCS